MANVSSTVSVVDAAKNRDYDHLWKDFFRTLDQTQDLLKANYVDLDPSSFSSLPVVIRDDKIICFSGLQVNVDRWGPGIGRCSSRMWYHPDYRIKGLKKFSGGDRFLNSRFCVPMQLAAARDLGLDCVFISKENNFKGFKQYVELLKINARVDFSLEEKFYNVCGTMDIIPESCKQIVAVHYLTDQGPAVWQRNMGQHQL